MTDRGPVDRLIAQWDARAKKSVLFNQVYRECARELRELADALAQGRTQHERLEKFVTALADDLRTDLRVNGYDDVGAGWFDIVIRQHARDLFGAEGRPQDAPPDAT